MKLLCMSDLHGQLPTGPFPTADVAVIAGDITPALHSFYGGHPAGRMKQAEWIREVFLPWTQTLPVRDVVLTWGNHDHVGEHMRTLLPLAGWPSHVHPLVNDAVMLDGVTFYGVPQTPRFYDWAFNEDDTDEALGRCWREVPDGTDVLVSHGPPYGVVDSIRIGSEHLGSLTQRTWLCNPDATNRPRLVICGHIHGSGGRSGSCGNSYVHNVALVNEAYQLIRQPELIVLPSQET